MQQSVLNKALLKKGDDHFKIIDQKVITSESKFCHLKILLQFNLSIWNNTKRTLQNKGNKDVKNKQKQPQRQQKLYVLAIKAFNLVNILQSNHIYEVNVPNYPAFSNILQQHSMFKLDLSFLFKYTATTSVSHRNLSGRTSTPLGRSRDMLATQKIRKLCKI